VTREEGWEQTPKPIDPPWLYDLDVDPGERYDVAKEHSDVVARLRKMADEHRRGVVAVEDQLAARAVPIP
jgi:arylsulfatase